MNVVIGLRYAVAVACCVGCVCACETTRFDAGLKVAPVEAAEVLQVESSGCCSQTEQSIR